MRLGDDILVLDGNDGDVEADHGAGLAREVARRRDDVLRLDGALVGDDAPAAGGRLLDRRHRCLAMDLGSELARALGHGLRQIGRLDVAVLRVLDGANDAIDVAERPDLLDLLRRQEAHVDADGCRDPGVVAVLVHAVRRTGEANIGNLLQADRLARLGLEALIKRDRMLMQLADRIGEVEQRQEPGRVPRRAGR